MFDGGFCLFTLFGQPGHGESSDELHGLLYPDMVVDPVGAELWIVGVERITHGPTWLYDLSVEMTHRALYVHATVE